MDTVAEAISDLTFAFDLLFRELSDLTEAEMTAQVIDPENGYTVRDILAHLAGWEDYVLDVLPVMLNTLDIQLPAVDASERNAQAIAARKNVPVKDILQEFEQKHHRILTLLKSASSEALTMRRTRNNQIFTIKSYVVDVLQQHILEHADQLRLWRSKNSPNIIDQI